MERMKHISAAQNELYDRILTQYYMPLQLYIKAKDPKTVTLAEHTRLYKLGKLMETLSLSCQVYFIVTPLDDHSIGHSLSWAFTPMGGHSIGRPLHWVTTPLVLHIDKYTKKPDHLPSLVVDAGLEQVRPFCCWYTPPTFHTHFNRILCAVNMFIGVLFKEKVSFVHK